MVPKTAFGWRTPLHEFHGGPNLLRTSRASSDSRRLSSQALRSLTVGLALVSTLALGGCTAPGSDDGNSQGDTAQGDTTQSGGGQGSPTETPGVEETEKGDIVATQEVTLPQGRGTATVEIEALRVDDQVQILTFWVTPHLADTSDTLNLFEFTNQSRFAPRLVDKANLKEYTTLEKMGKAWATDSLSAEAGDGETFKVWAVFAAPEDGATQFDVTITDRYPRFTDIPVAS